MFVIISTRPCDYCDHTATGQSQLSNTDPFTPAWPIRTAGWSRGVNFEFPAVLGILECGTIRWHCVCLSVADTITVGLMVSRQGRWYRPLSINRYNGGTNNTDSNLSVDGFDKGGSGFVYFTPFPCWEQHCQGGFWLCWAEITWDPTINISDLCTSFLFHVGETETLP